MSVRSLCIAAGLSALLMSCSSNDSLRETLGLSRSGPDEFRVYARPPLTVPPDFTLRAPGTPGANTAIPANEQAHTAVLATGEVVIPKAKADTAVPVVSASDLPTNADAQFLQDAGVKKADPQVRSLVQKENENGGVAPQNDKYLVNLSSPDGEPVVDPAKEAERLKENKEQNKPVTAGDTPTIEPQSKSIWSTIGDWF